MEAQTKQKLRHLMDNFSEFESTMLTGTRERREKEEHAVAELQSKMSAIEERLDCEIKDRAAQFSSLQAWCEEQITALKANLFAALEQNVEALDERITQVFHRIEKLNEDLEVQQRIIPEDIERRGEELTRRLEEFQTLFEEERERRMEREKGIDSRVARHENEVAEALQEERVEREKKVQELKLMLEDTVDLRKERITRFNKVIEKEVSLLKNAIIKESRIREREDDDIVNTLTTYTTKIQESLKVINTTEV